MVAGDGCRSGEYDLFLTVTDWYPTPIAAKAVQGLNASIGREPPPDWGSGWSGSLLSLQRDEGGELYGLPYHDGPEMLIYRRDLFDSEAEKQLYAETVGGPLEAAPDVGAVSEGSPFLHPSEGRPLRHGSGQLPGLRTGE